MLWTIRNKLTIEGKMINNRVDVLFQMSIHMQCWRALVRLRDTEKLDEAMGTVRRLNTHTRA
jgi:hypothetical protein